MDRTIATQVAAMLVVLAILVRWIPVDDPFKDPLGRGAPIESLRLDRYLEELEARDPLAPRAFMRGFGKNDPERWKAYFIRRMREAARIVEEHREDPSVFVQFKGVPRNEMWPLMYDLYPVPMIGSWKEDGSSEADPTEPGATVVGSRLERPTEEDAAQRKQQRQAERRADAAEGGR